MKRAKVHVEAISITCPHCGEFVANNRNHAFMHIDVDREELVNNMVRQCTNCQRIFALPVFVKKLGVIS